MSTSADGSRRSLKFLTGGLTRYKSRASIQTSGRGGAGNATTSMPSPSRNSLAEEGIRSPVGRDIPSLPKNNQILTTGRGGAGNTTSSKASRRHMSEPQTRAALAAEKELVQQRRREKALSSPLISGRGGAGNVRRSKQNKSASPPTLSQPYRSQTRSTSISTLVLDISAKAPPRLSSVALHERLHSFSDVSVTETRGAVLPSLSREGPETDDSWSITNSSFRARRGYVIPESTFGALADAHNDISSNHTGPVVSRCYAGSSKPSLTDTDGSCYRRRVPTTVAPFEEPPMFFYLTPMTPSSSQQSRDRSNRPNDYGSRPPIEVASASSSSLSSSLSLDKYYTPEPRARPDRMSILPPEQDAASISPLSPSPRPRFGPPASDPTPAISPRSPFHASSTPKLASYRTALDTYGFGGGSRPSTSGSSHHPSIADSVIEMESDHSYPRQELVLVTATTPSSRIPDQLGAPFVPFEVVVNPPPHPARTINAKIKPAISAIDPLTQPTRIPDTPPRIPISIFVDPSSRGYSMAQASPPSPLAPTLSSSPTSQYESFTPTFGTRPLPPLPVASRRSTYTSLAPSQYTFSSPPTSPTSLMEEETIMEFEM